MNRVLEDPEGSLVCTRIKFDSIKGLTLTFIVDPAKVELGPHRTTVGIKLPSDRAGEFQVGSRYSVYIDEEKLYG